MKKGQVTLFVLVAVLIVVVIGVGYVIVNSSSKATLNEEYFNQPAIRDGMITVHDTILNCRDDVTLDSLYIIGLQGGYYKQPEKVYDLGWVFFPYYYYEGSYLMPAPSTVEQQLELYVNDQFSACVKNEDFGEFHVDFDSIETHVSIFDDFVSFEMDAPLTVTREDNAIILEMQDFPKVYNFSLVNILSVAYYLTESHKQDVELFCIDCLHDLAESFDLYVDMITFAENTVMVVITDNNTFIDPYTYVYVNKYTGTEETPRLSQDVDVSTLPELN